ncbi:MAG: M18 family aminopeptidase [Lachnospiraceae bacterium]|nr:M18 family aminopeptidase [Lachnospiraceae bacterium]
MNKKKADTAATRLAAFLEKAVSPYHTVAEGKKLLAAAGFEELPARGAWSVKNGGKYYVSPFATTLFAFTVPQTADGMASVSYGRGLHIAAAHTDFPCLHVKPVAERESGGYLRVNTEIYGGPILNTWLDRPLSLAGRVMLRSSSVYEPKEVLVDLARPVLTIPNVAVHYNREVNDGLKLSKQNDLLPLMGMMNETLNSDSYFIDFLAEELKVREEDILDFDMIVYNAEKPAFIGPCGEMLSAPRLDNVTSCLALIEGLITSAEGGEGITGSGQINSTGVVSGRRCKKTTGNDKAADKKVLGEPANDGSGISLIALFDNEEIGSETKQGANSALLDMILRRIYQGLGLDQTILDGDISRGFLLSVDVAHALHPAHPEKYDPVNRMRMGDGVTLKLSANQRYTYDAVAVASLQQLCEKAGVKYKKFVNNSDMPGGGTLGPIISSHLPMYTVDIGVPVLAMHSARELMGSSDQDELVRLMREFL